MREVFRYNAPTFLDETRDPDWQRLDIGPLAQFDRPALLSKGTVSPPFFAAIVDTVAAALPRLRIETIVGADHSPHQTTTKQYVDLITRFVATARVA
jgi:pimeloyl-ACP methyl ester carboxylesterase